MPIDSNIPQPTRNTTSGIPIFIWGGIEFYKVPTGHFTMGSWEDNMWALECEKPLQIINIPYDYWMGPSQ